MNDDVELSTRVSRILNEIRCWAYQSRKNLDHFVDVFHDADEGYRHRAVLDIVVGKLGHTPEDAALVMVAMKAAWERGQAELDRVFEAEELS